MLLTAILKVHGLVVDPYGQDNFLSLPWMQVLTIEVEVLLGLWLLSGLARQFAWYSTLAFFCLLTCLSFTLAWQGQTDCGCFGKVKVNPWWSFGLDVGIVGVMLLITWFTRNDDTFKSRAALAPGGAWRSVVQVALITTSLLGLVALAFVVFTDDPWAALARIRGESLSVYPTISVLGEGVAGEQRIFEIQLKNNSDKSIKIAGGTTSCSCITARDLPVTISAGSTQTIQIQFRYTGSEGNFIHSIYLYSDGDRQLTTARFAGKLKPVTMSPGTSKLILQPNFRHKTFTDNDIAVIFVSGIF